MKPKLAALNEDQVNDVIGMAWCDKTSFEMIYEHTQLSEAEVKELMRYHLKASSYRMWRRRVTKNPRKQRKKFDQEQVT